MPPCRASAPRRRRRCTPPARPSSSTCGSHRNSRPPAPCPAPCRSRAGCWEFRADPTSPDRNPAFTRPTVITYCASGGRAALAGKLLQDLGYADVRNLGGFKDWVEAGGAVEKG
ncbi:rhodanese-like domain-containing protein [Siccirubricoccus sp. G192]|uniref:rhodanese-like domain-containing protein n=1 Tax=Siccirubricoccus sp. G192 TaxID=2849651 RepID=UPI001C2B8FBB|nr:rhodanese-like domain-containing protein [Siccirubricoccus sp. G192]MBV1795865.1 hypothetical protein [Siccirubricoccus sp. G192]